MYCCLHLYLLHENDNLHPVIGICPDYYIHSKLLPLLKALNVVDRMSKLHVKPGIFPVYVHKNLYSLIDFVDVQQSLQSCSLSQSVKIRKKT